MKRDYRRQLVRSRHIAEAACLYRSLVPLRKAFGRIAPRSRF
jgi:hypothetical protein